MSLENDLSTAASEQTAFWNLATRSGRTTSTISRNIQVRLIYAIFSQRFMKYNATIIVTFFQSTRTDQNSS